MRMDAQFDAAARAALHCEALVDNMVVLDGEAIVSVPGRPKTA